MDAPDDFLTHGLERVRSDLVDLFGATKLHLKPETVTRSLSARVRARLKMLETLLRRLILLLAMTLTPAPAKPGTPRAQASVPDGVEDVTASFLAGRRIYRFALMGRPLGVSGVFPDMARSPSGPVPAAPLLARIAALYRVLKKPEAAALRLARQIRRMKARGEARPYCLPMAGRHRLPRELALLAGALRTHVNQALAGWDDTG